MRFSSFVLSLGLIGLTAPSATASYVATCELEVDVVKVLSTTSHTSTAPHSSRAQFGVTKVISGGGHNANHCSKFTKRKAPFEETLRGPRGLLDSVIKGAKLRVKYRHISGMTQNGMSSNTTWTVAGSLTASAPNAPAAAPKQMPPTAVTKNPLSLALYCASNPSAQGCEMTEGPLIPGVSFDGKRLLAWDLDHVGGCASERHGLKGLTERKAASSLKKTKRHPITVADPEANTKAEFDVRAKAWAAVTTARKGFLPLNNLIKSHEERQAGIQSHSPVALLAGALEGWKLEAKTRGSRTRVTMTKGGKTLAIGGVKAPKTLVFDENSDKEKKVHAQFPSVEQVSVVTRGKQRFLLVVLSSHSGGHCASGALTYLWAKVPKGL